MNQRRMWIVKAVDFGGKVNLCEEFATHADAKRALRDAIAFRETSLGLACAPVQDDEYAEVWECDDESAETEFHGYLFLYSVAAIRGLGHATLRHAA